MASRLPVLALLAALTAQPVWAEEEPVTPFPGTSVSGTSVSGTSVSGPMVAGALADGGGKSAGAPPPLGVAAAGPAAEPTLPVAAAGDETAAAPDGGAEVPGIAAPGVDAQRSNAAALEGGMAEEEPATPAGGSRLLRALAELPNPGGVPGDVARSGTLRVSAAEGCPRALLRRLLAGAASEADALSALGIEREILTLCRERQEIVAGLFETEARLSELRQTVRGAEPEPQVPAPAAVETAAPSPLRAVLGGVADKANEGDPRAGDTRARDPGAGVPQPPRYAWFSIIGTAGALRAGVTDGTGVWFVRQGDPLPGGATIAAIAGRPPGVRVTGAGESGEATLLPFGARPGDAP